MEKAKNIISILKDGLLLILFLLLLFFPARFNNILVKAGFTEGSVMGFTWKQRAIELKQVADSSHKIALDAGAKMDQMQVRLDSISKNLVSIDGSATNEAAISRITDAIEFSKDQLKENKLTLKKNIDFQDKKLDFIFKDVPVQVPKN